MNTTGFQKKFAINIIGALLRIQNDFLGEINLALIKLTDIEDNREFLLNLNQIKAMFDQGDGVTRVVAEYHNFNVRETLQEIERLILRDQFAMAVLPSMPSNPALAYELADAMLEERGK